MQQIFRSDKHNIFNEEAKKIGLNDNDNKIMKSINSIETYTYGTSKHVLCKKEGSKCNNKMKQQQNKNRINGSSLSNISSY